MKYGYVCNICKYHFLSDDKEEVKEAKISHRMKGFNIDACPMSKLKNGHMARPDLVDFLNKGGLNYER